MAQKQMPTAAPRAVLEGLGELEGRVVEGVARFLAIPYAAPPLGTLRWSPPQAPLPWTGVRSNPRSLPQCPQPRHEASTFVGHRVVDTEDCLVLNVFTPEASMPSFHSGDSAGVAKSAAAPTSAALLPVVVYIHGGGGKFNSAHNPTWRADMSLLSTKVCAPST